MSTLNPPPVTVRTRRPSAGAVIIDLAGNLDASTYPVTSDAVFALLDGSAAVVVLTLDEVRVLGLAGVELLVQADRLARRRGICLRIRTGVSVAADRALRASGQHSTLPITPSGKVGVSE